MPDRTEEDKIREAFEKDPTLFVENRLITNALDFGIFKKGYKAGVSSQQEKIEELEKKLSEKDKQIEDLKNISDDHVSYLEYVSELEQKLLDSRLCGNCGTKIMGRCAVNETEPKSGDTCLYWKPRS